jgi:hypothetical protein
LRRVNISQVHQTCEMFRLKRSLASVGIPFRRRK